MSLKKTIDFSDFVTAIEAGELEAQATRKTFEYDSYAKQTRFVAIVLSEPLPFSSADVQHFTKTPIPTFLDDVRKSLAGATPANARRLSKFSFRARILGPNSPHSFLPDPCDAAYSGTDADSRAKNLKLITMHTLFTSTESYQLQAGKKLPNRGDLVLVELEYNDFSYNLQAGTFIDVMEATDAYHNIQNYAGASCATSLAGAFTGTGTAGGPPGAGPGGIPGHSSGGTATPNPYTYAECNATINKRAPKKMTIPEARALATALAPFLQWLAVYESGGGHNGADVVNVPQPPLSASPTSYSPSTGTAELGTSLTQTKVKDVIAAQAARKVFATGLYQQTPGPLQGAAAYFGLLNELYTADTQNILVMRNIFYKRPALGNYLLGLHDNKCIAGNELAYEWASVGIQADNAWSHISIVRTAPSTSGCTRGSTAYCGTPNAAHRSPDDAIAAIDAARRALQGDSNALSAIRRIAPTAGVLASNPPAPGP